MLYLSSSLQNQKILYRRNLMDENFKQIPYPQGIIEVLRELRAEEDPTLAAKFATFALVIEVPEEHAEAVFAEIDETIAWIERSTSEATSTMRETLALARSAKKAKDKDFGENVSGEAETADQAGESAETEKKTEVESTDEEESAEATGPTCGG